MALKDKDCQPLYIVFKDIGHKRLHISDFRELYRIYLHKSCGLIKGLYFAFMMVKSLVENILQMSFSCSSCLFLLSSAKTQNWNLYQTV